MSLEQKETQFIYPAVRSPTDKRDWIFKDINTNVPPIIDYRNQLTPVRNQGEYGSCFAMSSCCMKEYQERQDYNFQNYLSPKFFYAQRYNIHDDDAQNDEGMYTRDVMKILQYIGVCTEKSCPYINVDKKQDWTSLLDEAKQHVISHYARVDNLTSLLHAISENGVCLITLPVYNTSLIEFWKKNSEHDTLIGGHAVAIVGYNLTKHHFILRNSWGSSWGDKGYCYWKFSDWGSHWEIWTTIDDDTKIERLDDNNERVINKNICCNIF